MKKRSREALNALFAYHGIEDFRWIKAKDIVVAQWVRMKCMFGCEDYGSGACPPNVPSVEECQRILGDYGDAVLFHLEKEAKKPEYPRSWAKETNRRLLELEKAVFLSGHYKAFLLHMNRCNLCDPCSPDRSGCTNPRRSRPTPEALAIDVYATVRRAGYPIRVLPKEEGCMNRYAFLLIE